MMRDFDHLKWGVDIDWEPPGQGGWKSVMDQVFSEQLSHSREQEEKHVLEEGGPGEGTNPNPREWSAVRKLRQGVARWYSLFS